MALLNLPPLAEFQKILLRCFRARADLANAFLRAGFAWVPPGPLVSPGLGSPMPRLDADATPTRRRRTIDADADAFVNLVETNRKHTVGISEFLSHFRFLFAEKCKK